jgi:L-alanine-DL-glutamate epimerase-like enolase superfamily enzyme
MRDAAPVRAVRTAAYTIPTDAAEADGTYSWTSTTLVLVEVDAGVATGIGYTYADTATATLVRDKLTQLVVGGNALDNTAIWWRMVRSIRNLGRPGIASMAIAAVDNALWDLKAKLLDVPLVTLLGGAHAFIPVYGSGGFTSYDDATLARQLGAWVGTGILRVKMKVGSEPARDLQRVRVAREAIGRTTELFVDANGAYTRKQALAFADAFVAQNVTWFEEPVSSDDLPGLRLLRDRAPAGMNVSAGEYGYDLPYFERMLASGAIDVLQADATRCAGITGFMRVAALCEAHCIPLSSHCAPALHVHPACAADPVVHIEWFHDHVRIESLLFDGAPVPRAGNVAPDLSRTGLGMVFKARDAERFAA